jgi:hypothetical protein
MSRYEDGDKIYLFGFSRGAYTARSLGGLIGRCGLLLPGSPFSIQQVFERYRRGGDVPSLLDLQFRKRPRELWSREDEWLMEYSRRVWMLKKATDAGLRFKRELKLSGDECLEEPVDSYARFLKGVYRIVKLGRRHFRKIGRDRVATKKLAGWSHSVNESIDASVFERWRSFPKYRPKNLIEWANRHGVKPEEVLGDWPGST